MAWTPKEDAVLLAVAERDGVRRWSKVAESLPGRTPAMARNRWGRIQKGRQLREAGETKNKCLVCGQPRRGHVCGGAPDDDAREAEEAAAAAAIGARINAEFMAMERMEATVQVQSQPPAEASPASSSPPPSPTGLVYL